MLGAISKPHKSLRLKKLAPKHVKTEKTKTTKKKYTLKNRNVFFLTK